jgi:catechol 2,3-dioxygenase
MTMIRPALHHVTIKTSRMDKMIEWYGTVVGAKVQFRDQGACWIPTTRPTIASHS